MDRNIDQPQQNQILTAYNGDSKTLTNGHITTISHSTPPPAVMPSGRNSSYRDARIPALRRKVHRSLIRKHLHERYNRNIAPRLLMITMIVCIVLLTLLSTGAGAAYAYYQGQLPLLNGIADHALSQPRSLQVKSEEALLAYGLTKQYPKWKIMEMYLNTVYYGDLNYGVEAAAQDFFNLQPKCTHRSCKPATAQLDLAQASLLAGLPQSPSYY